MNRIARFEILWQPDDISGVLDCDCACPYVPVAPTSKRVAPETVLTSHPQQQRIGLSDAYSVVFVPSTSDIAVVNNAVLQLLKRFCAPIALHTLDHDEYAAAEQLYQLGLLQLPGSEPVISPVVNTLVVWLHVTNACNLRCTYCYVDKTNESMSADIGFTAVDTILRVAQLRGYGSVLLKYAGGEASLGLSQVERMHTYAKMQAQAMGIAVHGVILSNGVGLTDNKLICIKQLGLRLMISLDGPAEIQDRQRPTRAGRGSFPAVIDSLERASGLGLDMTVSLTVTSASAAHLSPLIVWLLQHELYFTLNLYRECDQSSHLPELAYDQQKLLAGMHQVYREIERRPPRYRLLGCLLDRANLASIHQHPCAVGEHYLVIDHLGNVAKCQMLINQPVTTIFTHNPLEAVCADRCGVQNIPVDAKEGCRECEWRYWCAGGCAVATQRATGRYATRSPNCSLYKALYPEVIRLEGLRLLYWHRLR